MSLFLLNLAVAIGANLLMIVGFLTSILFWKKLKNRWTPFLIGLVPCAIAEIGNIISGLNGLYALSVIVFVILSILFATVIALKSKSEKA